MAHKKRFTPKLLAVSIAAVIAGAQAAETNLEETEVISVTGIRNSIIQSTDLKKEASSVVDVITAEDVGKFPDDNVMDALKRITGVQVTQDETGTASGFQVRGISQNRVELNGRSVSAGEGEGRSANLGDIPAELIAGLEVIKSPTADMVEGSLGATVNLKTARPLSKKKSLTVLNVAGKYADNADETYGNFNGLISRKWDLGDWGKFGALLNVTHNENWVSGDVMRLTGWKTQPAAKNICGAYTISGDGKDVIQNESKCDVNYYAPDGITGLQYREEQVRSQATATLQWRPSESSELIMDVSYLKKEDNERRDTVKIGLRKGSNFLDVDRVTPLLDDNGVYHAWSEVETTNYEVLHNNNYQDATAGYLIRPVTRLTSDAAFFDGSAGQGEQHTNERFTFGLKGSWDLDSWRFEGEVGYSESEYERHYITMNMSPWGGNPNDQRDQTLQVGEGEGVRTGGSHLALDLSDPRLVSFAWTEFDGSPKVLNDPTHLRLASTQDDGYIHKPRESSVRFDADYDLNMGHVTTLEFGVRATHNIMERTERFRFRCDRNYNWDKNGPSSNSYNPETDDACEDPSVSVVDLITDYPDMFQQVNGFWDQEEGVALQPWLQISNDAYFENKALWKQAVGFTGYEDSPGEYYKLTEETAAAYVKANLEGQAPLGAYYRANFGVRGVYTEVEALTTPSATTQKSESNDYLEWLPSMNISLAFDDDTIVRFAAAKVMVRPSFDQIKPTGSFNQFTGCQVYDPSGYNGEFPNESLSVEEQERQLAQRLYMEAGVWGNSDACPGIRRQNGNNVGNLNLDPYTSNNFDLGLEQYWGEGNSASVTLFYRDVQADIVKRNAIYRKPADPAEQAVGQTGTLDKDYGDNFTNGSPYPLQGQPISTVEGYELWNVKEFANGGTSTRYGVELAYTQFLDMLPGILSGFGFSVNYTYSDGERPDPVLIYGQGHALDGNAIDFSSAEYADYDTSTYQGQLQAAKAVVGANAYDLQDQEALLPINEMSKHSANASLFYDKYDFNARLAYNYRSEYYMTSTGEGIPQYRDESERLDFSSGYNINKYVNVRFNINNLLRSKIHNYYIDPSITERVQYTDRVYTLGVGVKF